MGILDQWKKMPGAEKKLHPFDKLYGLLTLGIIESFGRGFNLLGKVIPGANKKWAPGERLQVLFLAYSGARNTGAEVRVAECIDQVNQVLGEENVDINMTALNLEEARAYFKNNKVNLKFMNSVFFADVFKLALKNHMIVLVEGSCWKENFASALLHYFLYGAGLASRLGKPCFSYAVDAGDMSRFNNFLSWYLSRDTHLITRTQDAKKVLEKIDLPGAKVRVDTAWTTKSESLEWGAKLLKERGWDGKKPLIGMAMQNYFWWPVIPDLARFAKSLVTGDKKNQYKAVYFYDYDEEDEKLYRKFAELVARTLDWAADTYQAQIVLVGMEAVDENACRDVVKTMKSKAIMISCNEFIGVQIASLLRNLNLLITTRYHAMVLSMPGTIPFIGLSRDERIRGVMQEIKLFEKYYLDYKDADLENRLRGMVRAIMDSPEEQQRIKKVIRENLPYYFAQMGMLGLDIRNIVRESFAGFPLKKIDEDKLENLIPHVPPDLAGDAQRKFLELKKNAGKLEG